jgi:hypothetical protein
MRSVANQWDATPAFRLIAPCITSPSLDDRVASLSTVHQNVSSAAIKIFDELIVNDYNKIVKRFSYELFSIATVIQNQPAFRSINIYEGESNDRGRWGIMLVH